MIPVQLDRKAPQGHKVWLGSKVRLAHRVPLDRRVLLVRREKPDCKDPPDLRVSAAKLAHLDRPAKKARPEKWDLPDQPAPQVSVARRDLRVLLVLSVPPGHPDPQVLRDPQLPLQPQTYGHSKSMATLWRVRLTRCWFPQSARTLPRHHSCRVAGRIVQAPAASLGYA